MKRASVSVPLSFEYGDVEIESLKSIMNSWEYQMTFITIIKYYNSKHVSGYSDYYFIFACSTSSIIGIATC
ncbi:hypothetical protein JCM15754A_09830 [Prevotella aurantiaca JCM 15754]